MPRAAEVLAGLKAPAGAAAPKAALFPAEPSYGFRDTEPDDQDSDELLLARAFFDAQEYSRAAHAIDGTVTPAGVVHTENLPPKALALRCFALYMVR